MVKFVYAVLFFLMIVLDQIVKLWAKTSLKPVFSIEVIPNVFKLTYVENTGAAFSILQGKRWFFICMTIIVCLFVVYLMYRKYFTHLSGIIASYFILAGAIGNFIDRLARGYVIDLFDLRFINFPIFNLADVYVTTGAVVFAYYIFFRHDESSTKQDENIDERTDQLGTHTQLPKKEIQKTNGDEALMRHDKFDDASVSDKNCDLDKFGTRGDDDNDRESGDSDDV